MRTFKKVFQLLLIIGLILSCSNGVNEISSSVSISTDVSVDTDTVIESKLPFDEKTYVNIYAPWVKWDNDKGWMTNVSYLDTNTLNLLWRGVIEGGTGGKEHWERWMIRDGDNRETAPINGNYYYFDKNMDIVYMHQTHNDVYKVKVKEFMGGVIIQYSEGWRNGTLAIGGLYRILLDKHHSQGRTVGYERFRSGTLNEFMREIHNLGWGNLTVISMNTGFGSDSKLEYGVDEYYSIGKDDPNFYLGKNPYDYINTFGWYVNHSWDPNRYNFYFVPCIYDIYLD